MYVRKYVFKNCVTNKSFLLNYKKMSKPNPSNTSVGLDGAGKTTFLNRLKTNTLVKTTTTICCNSEVIRFKFFDFEFWDIGGGDKMRPLWLHYYGKVSAMVFVLDASDKERATEAADKLHYLLTSTDNTNRNLLIVGNKQELGDCLTEEQIIEIFRLRTLETTLQLMWHIQPASVKEGYGLTEGMEWLWKTVD